MTEKWRTHPWGNMGSATHVVGTHVFPAKVKCLASWHLLCKPTLWGFKHIKKSKIFLDFRRKLKTLFIKIELAKDFIRPKRKIAIATLKFKLSIPQRMPIQSQKRVSETVFFYFWVYFCKYQKKKIKKQRRLPEPDSWSRVCRNSSLDCTGSRFYFAVCGNLCFPFIPGSMRNSHFRLAFVSWPWQLS